MISIGSVLLQSAFQLLICSELLHAIRDVLSSLSLNTTDRGSSHPLLHLDRFFLLVIWLNFLTMIISFCISAMIVGIQL